MKYDKNVIVITHFDLDISVLPRHVDLRISQTVEHTWRVHFPHLGTVSPDPTWIRAYVGLQITAHFNIFYIFIGL